MRGECDMDPNQLTSLCLITTSQNSIKVFVVIINKELCPQTIKTSTSANNTSGIRMIWVKKMKTYLCPLDKLFHFKSPSGIRASTNIKGCPLVSKSIVFPARLTD